MKLFKLLQPWHQPLGCQAWRATVTEDVHAVPPRYAGIYFVAAVWSATALVAFFLVKSKLV